MAYNTEGLSVVNSSLSGGGPNRWLLQTADALTAVRVDGYISDASDRGVQVGDIVDVVQWTTFTNQYTKASPMLGYATTIVLAINANGSADLADGTGFTITDTD